MPFFSHKCTASFVPSAFLTEVPYYWPLDTWLSTGYFYSSYNAIPMFSHQLQTQNDLYTAPPTEVPCYRLPDTWLNTSCFLLSVTWFQYFCINLGHITSFAPMVFPTRSLFQQPVTWSNGRCLRKFHAIDCQALIGYRFLSPFPKDDSGIHRLLPDF